MVDSAGHEIVGEDLDGPEALGIDILVTQQVQDPRWTNHMPSRAPFCSSLDVERLRLHEKSATIPKNKNTGYTRESELVVVS